MKKLMQPLETSVDMETGLFKSYDNVIERRLSDMEGMYADIKAYEKLLNEENKLVYRVYGINIPREEEQLLYSSTIIYPGKVGSEYFMTNGHFHTKENTAELYICLQGEGYLLMQTKEAQISSIYMRQGTIGYIPPYWSHRTINTGNEKFVFLAIYPYEFTSSPFSPPYGERIKVRGKRKFLYYRDIYIKDIKAVEGRDVQAVNREIVKADIMTTAVGAKALKGVALLIAEGVKRRADLGIKEPINIIMRIY